MRDDNGAECFVDSNVWLYAIIEADDPVKTAAARNLLQTASPVVSVQVINEVCVNLIRRAAFSEEQVREVVRSFYQQCRVVDLEQIDMLRASALRERYSLSFWDGLILAAALGAGVGVVATEDMQDGLVVDGALRIENPFAAA
jgi:predicted nucleic acid-binding protein